MTEVVECSSYLEYLFQATTTHCGFKMFHKDPGRCATTKKINIHIISQVADIFTTPVWHFEHKQCSSRLMYLVEGPRVYILVLLFLINSECKCDRKYKAPFENLSSICVSIYL